jgi:hypothetical protein
MEREPLLTLAAAKHLCVSETPRRLSLRGSLNRATLRGTFWSLRASIPSLVSSLRTTVNHCTVSLRRLFLAITVATAGSGSGFSEGTPSARATTTMIGWVQGFISGSPTLNEVWISRERQLDGNLPAVDTLRGVFTEGRPIYPGAGFDEKTHIQIVVRNQRCIKGVFRVSGEPVGPRKPLRRSKR